jgi:hypothetical protein
MVTAGDIQFEPPSEKIVFLTSSIAVMGAGDSAFHHEVLTDVMKEVVAKTELEPNEWWNVRDVADVYLKYGNMGKLKRAEAALLAPLGLDRTSFLQAQKTMDAGLVDSIARDLIGFQVPDTQVIIAGVDNYNGNGCTHIYALFNDYISCDDVIGFRAIGSGARHAESQFMLARHAWNNTPSDTLLLAYCAKKNAEIAPGVGSETDMVMIGPGVGKNTRMNDTTMTNLDEAYRKIKSESDRIQRDANAEIARYVDSLSTPPAVAQADKPTAEEATTAPDPKTTTKPPESKE